jgi:hypothetical protein
MSKRRPVTPSPRLACPFSPGCVAGGGAASRPLHLVAALFALVLLAPNAPGAEEGEQRNPDASAAGNCRDCGVIRSIREIRTERQLSRPDIYVTSPQYLATRQDEPPRIGPVLSFSWGSRNEPTTTRIGAVGSPQMQQRFIDLSYEITVRFNDGRYALIEQDDVGNLRIGDRVQVADRRVVRVK